MLLACPAAKQFSFLTEQAGFLSIEQRVPGFISRRQLKLEVVPKKFFEK
jgi:hypothetical protein